MSGSGLLYRATYRGNSVEIGLAGDAELAAIAGSVFPASMRDVLDGQETEVRALGWRVALGNTCVTSVLVGGGMQAWVVSTRAGHAYRLEIEDMPELCPELWSYLTYALRT